MPIGKFETVILNVKDIEKAVKFYSELFDIAFEPIHQYTLPGDIDVKEAFSPAMGLDLIQQTSPTLQNEGVRAITVRVKNLGEASSRIKKMGIPLLRELKSERAHMVEEIYGMNGYLLILAQHDDF
jgi:predicted enzyme related to lactoylglutathione lyase